MRRVTTDLYIALRFLVVAACVLLTIWLSLKSVPIEVVRFSGSNKVHHALAYCGLTLVVGWAFAAIPRFSEHRWRLAVVLSVSLGGFIEILQLLLTRTRHARFTDLLADLLGAVVAWCVVKIAEHRTGKSGDRFLCL